MNKRRIERIAVMLLSIAMLLSSTGIMSSLAVDTSGAYTSASSSVTSPSTTIAQEGGKITTTTVTSEGGALGKTLNGEGTASNPYIISDSTEFLSIQNIANRTTSSNKYFVLANDIDLSSIKSESFKNNNVSAGSLVSINKSLSNASSNVYFVLDGQGHKITGLNVLVNGVSSFSVFGYLNNKSVVKNLTVSSAKLKADKISNLSVIVSENDGTISNCVVYNPCVDFVSAANFGLIAAVNNGTISNSTVVGNQTNAGAASSESHTIFGAGVIGAICGTNNGKIICSTAKDIGAYVNSASAVSTVYGGVVGSNSGTVNGCVSTGNVIGDKLSDYAGGVVGSALKGTVLQNNYTLVSISDSVSGNAVIGNGGSMSMVKDCYWSSTISHRNTMLKDYGTGINDISYSAFKIINKDATAVFDIDDFSYSWGKANLTVDGGFSCSNDGVIVDATASSVKIKAVKEDTVSFLSFKFRISLPSQVGSGFETLVQYFNIPIIVSQKTSVGNGTATNPFVVMNASEFNLIRYAKGISVKLGSDISADFVPMNFNGNIDGNGHTIITSEPICAEVCGNISNLNVTVVGELSSAVFGKISCADIEAVNVSVSDSASFVASKSCSGVLFDKISGDSTVRFCSVIADNIVVEEKIKNFGAFVGEIEGENPVIENCSASANIAAADGKKAENSSCFVGLVSAKNAVIKDCCVDGKNSTGKNLFIGAVSSDKLNVRNIILSKKSQQAVDFSEYKFINESEFKEWNFESGDTSFFTGNGGAFEVEFPAVSLFESSKSDDFEVKCDNAKLITDLTVKGNRIIVTVARAAGVVTVKDIQLALISKKTGLSTSTVVSNGLEKDGDGNYLVTSAYDLEYMSENVDSLNGSSFLLANDIDMSVVAQHNPIGSVAASFVGTFNGNGHTIKNLNVTTNAKSALFGVIENSTVTDVVFKNATIKSDGLYTAVLAGQAIGKNTIKNISVVGSKVITSDIYSGLIVGSADGADSELNVSSIDIFDSSIMSTANYVGAVAGHASCNATVSNVKVESFTAEGAEFVGGIVGLADGDFAVAVSGVEVIDAKIVGVNEISGITSGNGKNSSITAAIVKNTKISTIGSSNAYVAGGVASSFAGTINNIQLDCADVSAGISGGVVGKTISDGLLKIQSISVKKSTISAVGSNTISSAVLGSHSAKGAVNIEDCKVDSETSVKNAAISAGIVGECSGTNSVLSVNNCDVFANIENSNTADAVASSGIVGVASNSVANISVCRVNVLGTVGGKGAVAGAVAVVKGNGMSIDKALLSDCVLAPCFAADDGSKCGIIFADVNKKIIDNSNIENILSNVVISTYQDRVEAYSEETKLDNIGFIDLDNPNGKSITTSVDVIHDTEKTTVNLSNLPSTESFDFDAKTGWVSSSADRIDVVSSTESSVVLQAKHSAEISVIGYYVFSNNADVRVPVHFIIKSDYRVPLKGKGTENSPYLVSNAYDLETVAQYESENKYFVLTDDIEFKADDFEFGGSFYNIGNGIVTIGNASSGFKGNFSGLYMGKVHALNGMKICGNTFGGLFGATDGAEISNIIINSADVSGLSYAGIVAGKTKNTIIRNIQVNNSVVKSEKFGSVVGGLVGYAYNTIIDGASMNNVEVLTTLDATSATVEISGSLCGVFSGKISNAVVKNAMTIAGTVAGGLVGESLDSETVNEIENSTINSKVSADVAAGLVGVVDNALKISVRNTVIGGSVYGKDISAGVIANVVNYKTLASAGSPMLDNVIVAADVSDAECRGAVIGLASEDCFVDSDNAKTEVFRNVYYSSYQCGPEVFGVEEIEKYQSNEYAAVDLNEIKYGKESVLGNEITLSSDYTEIDEDAVSLKVGSGTYKAFSINGIRFSLNEITSDCDGLISYNDANNSVKLNKSVPNGAKLVFCYDNGLKLTLGIAESIIPSEGESTDSPIEIATKEDFIAMMNSHEQAGKIYKLVSDIDLAGVESANMFAGTLDGNGYTIYNYRGYSLFGAVKGTIKNLGIVGFDIKSEKASVGALAEVLDGATVENCYVTANVVADGKAQDAGVVCGRAVNGAVISNCVVSGKVIAKGAIAVGSVAGASINSNVKNVLSTAFVSGGNYAGGIIGSAELTKIDNAIFANMVRSGKNREGNILGEALDGVVCKNVYFDKFTVRSDKYCSNKKVDGINGLNTDEIKELSLNGFTMRVGYPVPSSLLIDGASSKFDVGRDFAATIVRYMIGLNPSDAMSYTDIKLEGELNPEDIRIDKSGSLTITLVSAEYEDVSVPVERTSNPISANGVTVSVTVNDNTSKLVGKLAAVMLKSKYGNESNSFGFFTTVGSNFVEVKDVNLNDDLLYADIALPIGYTYSVDAIDARGNKLNVVDKGSDGFVVETNGSSEIKISYTIDNKNPEWGLRAIWSAIGK